MTNKTYCNFFQVAKLVMVSQNSTQSLFFSKACALPTTGYPSENSPFSAQTLSSHLMSAVVITEYLPDP